MRNFGSKNSSLKKARKARSLNVEMLEKREMLSVAPVGVEEVDFLDGNGNLKYGGTLNYTVLENDTDNRDTCIIINGVQLGGEGGQSSVSVPVAEGSALPTSTLPEGAEAQEGTPLDIIRIEDWTDDDYDDLVVEITFTPFTQGSTGSSVCTPCSCDSLTNEVATNDENHSRPANNSVSYFRFESTLPTISTIPYTTYSEDITETGSSASPVRMTATLEMGTLSKTVYYDTTELDPSENFAVGMNLDTSSLATGRYAWTMNFVYEYADGTTRTETFNGFESIVNLADSPYGSGINLTGLSRLNLTNYNASTERGINWERSCGKQVWFAYDGTTFTPQAGESAESTLTLNSDGTFTVVDQGETFLFNAQGQLLTRTDNLTQEITTWSYNADGTAASKTEEGNRVTNYGYSNGKLQTVTDFAGRVTTYAYDSLGRLTTITEPDPDGEGALTAPVTTYTYDGDSSRILTVTDPAGNVTAYTYSNGQVLSKTVNGIVESTQNPYALSAVADTTQIGYDADHPATLQSLLSLNGESINSAGDVTEYRYDKFGNVVWQKNSSGTVTTFSYDSNGRLLKETESGTIDGKQQGRTTEYSYDSRGNLTVIKYHDGSTEKWTYDSVYDQVLSYTDQLGNQTVYTLDSQTGLTLSERHVIGEIDSVANGETNDVVTAYAYDDQRRLVLMLDACGVATAYTYDSRGNLLTEMVASGTANASTTTYTYDNADRVTSVANALNQTTAYTYDALDRLITTTYADGQTATNTYNNAGQLVQTTDRNGAITAYTYNALGKIATVVSAGSSISYTYDSLGRVATETDSLGRTTSYTYNSGGKLIQTTVSTTDGESVVISQTTYDNFGRVATETDATGVTLSYTYDKFDHVTKITRTNDNVTLETRTYDLAGNLKTVSDALNRTTTYTYDALGNLTQVKMPDNTTTTYTYDKLGRVLTETDALGNVTSYAYDVYGNLITTTDALGAATTSAYNAISQLVSTTDAQGNVTTYAYDNLGRSTSTTLTDATGTQSTTQTTAYATQVIDGVKYQVVTTTDALNQTTVNYYDLAGNLIQTVAPDNSTTTYVYGSENQLLSVADALNRVTAYTYDGFGNVSAITQADGSAYQYDYNAAGQLLSQTDPLGVTTAYTYNYNGQVTQTEIRNKNVPEELGRWLENSQTFNGVDDSIAIENTDKMNFEGEITLSAWVKVEKTTGIQGIIEHGFYGDREVYLRIVDGKFQAGNYIGGDHCAETAILAEDIGAWVHLTGTYDGENWNLYKNGVLVASAASTVGAVTVGCEWLIGASKFSGRHFEGEIRDVGIWDTSLSATEVATLYEEGFSDVTVQSTATYDLVGNLLTQTDAMGNTTTYTYDNMGRVLTMADALNNVTSYTYDSLGRLLTTKDARGNVTQNIYDAVGNLLETRQYDNSVLSSPLDSWLPNGQEFNGVSDTINLGNSASLNFEGEIAVSVWVKIDATGGLKTILGHGHDYHNELYLRLLDDSYQFGSWDGVTGNHLVSATIPAEDIGTWVHLTGTYDGTNWNLYRNGELLASQTDTEGCATVNANWHIGSSNGNDRFFDGEIRDVSIWDTSLTAEQVATLYDASATITPSEVPEGDAIVTPTTPAESDFASEIPFISTTYTYDALGRLTSLTDAVGNTTSYTYDYRGLVLSETNENLDARYYSYDALGRLTQKTDRNERVTTYNYDAMGRLTSEKWLGESDAVLKTFAYAYDAVGNLLTVSDGEHSYSYAYDNKNQNIGTIFNFDGQTAVFNYAYDAVGRQTESSLTLNSTQTRVNQVTYDFLGNATKIKQTGSAIDEIFAEFDYNANGLLTSVRRYEVDADDVATAVANSIYEYNANNAVTSITHNNSSGTEIVKHSYTYDSTNNIVEYLNSLDGNTTYDYDFLGQLISADYANATITDESYTYDSNGNRVVANGSTYTTSTNNELTSDGAYTYTYDDEGNRISKQNSTNRELYTWDYRNRLTKVTQQEWDSTTETWTTTQTIEYTYDYNNVWIRKINGSDKTIFIPENYQTTVQIDNGAITHHYLWTPNQQDKLLADVTADNVLWTLTDHLGSIRDVVQQTSSGLVVPAHIIYDAYGNVVSCTNSEGETISNPILFGYTGKAFDTSTQLQNNINRWYDASIGRWLSIDPIDFEGNDTNLYRYVGNQNTGLYDPFGFARQKHCTIDLYVVDNFEAWDMLKLDNILIVDKPLFDRYDLMEEDVVDFPAFPKPKIDEWGPLPDNYYFDVATCWSYGFLQCAPQSSLIQPNRTRPRMDRNMLPVLQLSNRLNLLFQAIPNKMKKEKCTSYCVSIKCGNMAKDIINTAIQEIDKGIASRTAFITKLYNQMSWQPVFVMPMFGNIPIFSKKQWQENLKKQINNIEFVNNMLKIYKMQLEQILNLCDTTITKDQIELNRFQNR